MTFADYLKKALDKPSREDILVAICKNLEQNYHFACTREDEELYIYDNGVHRREKAEVTVKEALRKAIPGITRDLTSEVVNALKERSYRNKDEFDPDDKILVVENGLLNMDTLKLSPHTPEYLSRRKLPSRFVKRPRSGKRVEKFLDATLDAENKRKVLMMLGDILTRGYKYQTIFILVGNGANGKGTLGRLIKKFVGQYLFTDIRLHLLTESRFARAELDGKMVNFAGDVAGGRVEDWAMLRSLSGGDSVPCERKGRDFFSMVNEAKLIFSFNELPVIDDSFATSRRILLIKFDRTFVGEDEDKNLDEKLQTDECLSELLNLALKGRKILIKNGGHDKNMNFRTPG